MQQLFIVGLGRGDITTLSAFEQDKLAGVHSFMFTAAPPHLQAHLEQKGRHVLNLEASLGQPGPPSFMERREKMVSLIREVLKNEQTAAFVFPGRPWPGETLAILLRLRLDSPATTLQYLPGEDIILGLLECIYLNTGGETNGEAGALGRGVTFLDASCGDELKDQPRGGLLIAHLYSSSLLAKLQERLGHVYPADHPAEIWQFNHRGKAVLSGVWTLKELAVLPDLPLHAWSFLYLHPPARFTPGDLLGVMTKLRSPEGCPWDRQQDHLSLRPCLLEEAYEVLEAINRGDTENLCEELGDLLLQVVFHSELAREQGVFSFGEVVEGITSKLYRRHPHVFRGEKLADAKDVIRRWQEIKSREKGGKVKDRLTLPLGLPALMQAQKIQGRAADVGFDWPHIEGALKKVVEEYRELEAERATSGGRVEEEYGDLLFALVNVARFLEIDAEQALLGAVKKFTRRFRFIEKKVCATGREFDSFSLEELDDFWKEAKMQGNSANILNKEQD